MEEEKIKSEVKNFIENNILAGGNTIEAGALLQDAGIDSFSIVEIILFIERKYGLVIPNEEMLPENFKTIEAVAKTVQRLL